MDFMGYIAMVTGLLYLGLEINGFIKQEIPFPLQKHLNEVVQQGKYYRYQFITGLI